MKALSLKQPWGWAVVEAGKWIENRKWNTNFRGKFLIHVSKNFDYEGYQWLLDRKDKIGMEIPPIDSFVRGGIIGQAEIIDCVKKHDNMWFFGPYGFVLKDIKPLEYKRCKGMLNFFNIDII